MAIDAQENISVHDFGVGENMDATPGIIAALEHCKNDGGGELSFNKGIYHFYPEQGTDKYCFISNNDEGLKRVIFLIEGFDQLTINGNGSKFIFHGFVNPFVIDHSTQIVFKNFSIDVDRPFHSEGVIVGNHPDGVDIEISPSFPFRIHNNLLLFTNRNQKDERQTTVSREITYPYGSLLEFDTQKRETAYMAKDYYLNNMPLVAESLEDNKVRIFLKGLQGTVGNTLVFGAANRNYPGFVLSDSKDIRFDNITIHHCGGMGIVGQRTHNITVESCNVIPSEGRMVSATADATHFTNCTGKIELSHCEFRNQKDDATNIHGIYVQISKIINPYEAMVKLKHGQQLGFDFLKKGTPVEFVQGKSLITKGTAKIVEYKRINKELTYIKFSEKLPEGISEGDAIGENAEFAEIHIHDNYIGKNRARGMLLNCRGKTVVERNIFHSPGAAILFEGDASYWFEQGGVKDCTIRNNIFENCLFGVWGEAVIDVQAGILENREQSRYNQNIKIYDNLFKIFDDVLLLHAYGMKDLVWKNNKVERTHDYPATRTNTSYFKIENCDNINIEQD